jgi:NAD(P)-dependent dehydrogenase (short-subunit alcohol dehydrogenase family)
MTTAGGAVVIGGGSGIDAAVAARQRLAGIDVAVWDIIDAADVVCDISDADQVDSASAATVAKIGVPSIVTISAGIGHGGLLLDASGDQWDRVMGVNAKGVWLAMRALARFMLAGGGSGGSGGSIVVVSSVSARLVDRSMGLYCASKAALEMVIKVSAVEWAPTLRVNGVAPGVTDTPMLGPARRDGPWLTGVARRTALGRLGTADDIAEAVLAVHDMKWVTGQIIECDGGLGLRSPIDPLGETRG